MKSFAKLLAELLREWGLLVRRAHTSASAFCPEPQLLFPPTPRAYKADWPTTHSTGTQASDLTPQTILRGCCPVCGQHSTFSGFTENLRESGVCSNCGSFSRQRQMARAVRWRMGLSVTGPLVLPPGTTVYNTETTGALDATLRNTPSYLSSEHFGPQFAPGVMVDGRRHEDLQNLSLLDESIDLVLSSDVFEHMPFPYAAHREVFRILKPMGRHIFTVPFSPGLGKDDVRAEIADGQTYYRAEKLFHGDPVRPNEGVLVWTIFGMEMFAKLHEIGFEVSAWNVYAPTHGIVDDPAIVFEAHKPARVLD